MKYLDNPNTVVNELNAIFEVVRNEDNGYRHDAIRFIGQDVYDIAMSAFPGVFQPKEFNASNDYSGHRSKMSLFMSKNKSRATFEVMYGTEIYANENGQIHESTFHQSMEHILCVDGRRFQISFKRSGAIADRFYELGDIRDYRSYLPYDYDDTHPKPAKGVSALTDAKLDAWIGHLTEKQKTYDDIFYKRFESSLSFIQSIRDNIDPSKCEKYDVREDGGTVIANNLRFTYSISHGVVIATVDVYCTPYTNEVVHVFAEMTGAKK